MRRSEIKRGCQCTANVGDVTLKGTAQHIVVALEKLGYEAERSKDNVLAQTYFQGAEHYKKLIN